VPIPAYVSAYPGTGICGHQGVSDSVSKMARGLRALVLLLVCDLFRAAAAIGFRTQPSRHQGKAKAKAGTKAEIQSGDDGSDGKPPRPILPGTNNNPSKKYLLSTFPTIKQVGYLHLPDTVWRPLTIGNVSDPRGLAVDPAHQRIFVADVAAAKIYWYSVYMQDDGLLKTDGLQHTAVDGYVAKWMACNGVGDLYFTGSKANDSNPSEPYPSVWRQDGVKITNGDALSPVEVYGRSNTGSPNPMAYSPSGIAVDSFMIYWGNEEKGTENGAVCKGTRQNIGKTSGIVTSALSKAVDEVRGMAVTGEKIFYLSPNGLFSLPKTQTEPITDDSAGLIIQVPMGDKAGEWDPQSIAYDGDGTLYFTDKGKGIIYSIPEGGNSLYPLTKFVDAPQAYGCQIMSLAGNSAHMEDQNELISARAEELESGAESSRGPGRIVVLLAAFGAALGIMHS